MAPLLDDFVLDGTPERVEGATDVHVCTGTPVDRAAVLAASLATTSLVAGDFTNGDHPTSGRQVTVAAKAGVTVDVSGTPGSYCLIDGADLLARADADPTSDALTAGGTVNIPAVSFSTADPVSE